MNQFSRRTAIKAGAVLGGAALLSKAAGAFDQPADNEHFMLHIHFKLGIDSSYLFDARPLNFTLANKIQNYLGEDPSVWTGDNGLSTYTSSLVAPLKRFKDCFSVINGVHMASSFDGHDQNENALWTGNPFGGESYISHLNSAATQPTPLDFLEFDSFFTSTTITNASSALKLDPDTAKNFSEMLVSRKSMDQNDPTFKFLSSRLEHLSSGQGQFSQGSRRMLLGLENSFDVADRIKSLDFHFAEGDSHLLKRLKVTQQYFKRGITKSSVIKIDDHFLDTHAAADAVKQPQIYRNLVGDIETILNYLKTTPFDETRGRSLLDVTTVIFASEFGRSNYQVGKAMDKTGTDHNPLSNMMLIA